MDACGSLLLTATIMQSLYTETESDWSLKNNVNNTSCNRIITIVTGLITVMSLYCTITIHAGLLRYTIQCHAT